MLIIGLTGGIASGKSFVEERLVRSGIPVFDADKEVHKLISSNKKVFLEIKKAFPKAIVNEKIDRRLLGLEVFVDKDKLQKLEQIIYPFLHKEEDKFLKVNQRQRQKMVVLNIPLLFEKGRHKRCDKTIAVIASKKIRLDRFKKRFKDVGNVEIQKKFNYINSHQITDSQRKAQADFLIHNSLSKDFCNRQIKTIIKTICNLQNPVL